MHKSKKPPEHRHANVRRDLNDLVRDESGRVSEAKAWASVGKLAAVYLLIYHSENVINHWDALAILLLIVVAPDLLKKWLTMKYGAVTNGATK